MRENYRNKMKSIISVMIMLLAAATAGIVMIGSISAAGPTAFDILTPTDGSSVTKIVNITWSTSSASASVYYVVKVDNTQVANTTNTYYNWNSFFERYAFPTNFTHSITVTAYNSSDWSSTDSNSTFWVAVQGTPGLGIWECGNVSVGYDVLNTSTANIQYGVKISGLKVNGSCNWGSDIYNLYYPVYYGERYGDSPDYNLSWIKYKGIDGTGVRAPQIDPSINDYTFGNGNDREIRFNRSGLWLIGPETGFSPDASTLDLMNSTIPAWFWVNTTTDYTIKVDEDEFVFDSSGSVRVTLSGGPRAMVAIYADYNGKLIQDGSWAGENQQTKNQNITAKRNSSSFTHAGNYTVAAYWDIDGAGNNPSNGSQIGYFEGSNYYRYYNVSSYGSPSFDADFENDATWYNFTFCGPWDPPEYNATPVGILVTTATPNIKLTNTTQYWGFPGRIDINVTDSDGKGIPNLNVSILNETQSYPPVYYAADTDSNGNTSISSKWLLGDQNGGTWMVVVRASTAGDGTLGDEWGEEWNNTAEFEVEKSPGLQIKILDDGDGDNDLEISNGPPSLPGAVQIEFQVINETHKYYGKDNTGGVAQARKNITISGDACLLSGKTLQQLHEIGNKIVTFDGDRNWTVNLIPRMDTAANGGGEIIINANWKDSGGKADSVSIQVGGSKYNGSLVSITPTEIPIDEDITLTVKVTDPSDPSYGYKGATVRLYYLNESGYCNHIINGSTSGSTSGEYTFLFNRTQQTTNQSNVNDWSGGAYKANRYVIAYASTGTRGKGYASAKLVPNHNFKVTVEAGDKNKPGMSTLMAGRDYDWMYFNVSTIDSTGNVTGYPKIGTGQNKLHFRVYNSTGGDVTDNISASFDHTDLDLKSNSDDANHSLGGSNHYIVKPGVYTVYVWNNTYDSEGHNATLEVKRVDVTCSLSELIWQYDENNTATFYAKYKGNSINGTLRIDNMTDVGDYNKTWTNCSFNGANDLGGNKSMELTKSKGFTNGQVTIHNITASFLPSNVAQKNITFWFKSDKSSSRYARASGVVPVKIPDVSASPKMIPYNIPAELELTVTGRGTGLEDVWVSIKVPGLSGARNTTTLTNGLAKFAFIPPSTGTIIIKVENRTSDTKVRVTSWALYLDIPATANEGSTFTATVRNGSSAGSPLSGATVTFNKQTYTTGADGTATLNAPSSVSINSAYTVTATKEGYAPDSDTIMIINLPNLYISIDPERKEYASGDKVTVTAGGDDGNSYGITVTLKDSTGKVIKTMTTAGPNGIKFTIPTVQKKGTYTLTATKTGYVDAEPVTVTVIPGTPGFELLTLIVAIGVALILLRRRRH